MQLKSKITKPATNKSRENNFTDFRGIGIPVNSTNLKWEEFTDLLLDQLRSCTRVANSLIHMLALNDYSPVEIAEQVIKAEETQDKEQKKIIRGYPNRDKLNVYQWATALAPDIDTQTASAISRKVSEDYMSRRMNVLYHMKERFPYFSFPFPVICSSSKDYDVFEQDGAMFIHVKLGRVRDENEKLKPRHVVLRLDNSAGHQYGITSLRKTLPLHSNIKRGTLQISLKHGGQNSNKPGLYLWDKHGHKHFYRIIATVAVDFSAEIPQRELSKQPSRPLVVHTDPKFFLEAILSNNVAWRLNNRNFRAHFSPGAISARIERHKARRLELAQDKKFERRCGHRSGIDKKVSAVSEHQNNWLNDRLHTIAKQVVEFARRRSVSVIYYNDDEKSFISEKQFPWFRLADLISKKASAQGIGFEPLKVKKQPEIPWKDCAEELIRQHASLKRASNQAHRERALGAALTAKI